MGKRRRRGPENARTGVGSMLSSPFITVTVCPSDAEITLSTAANPC